MPWLLIFDNVEDNEALIQNWPVSGNGSIVVTCRSEFKSMSPAANSIEVLKFSVDESVELMLKLVGKSDINDEETAAARELADRVGGLAIAIDILAQQILMRKRKISDFLATYNEHRMKMLSRPKRGARDPYYDKDVNTIWSTAFEAMSHNSGRLLSLLCYAAPDEIPQGMLSTEVAEGLVWPFLQDFDE